MKIINKYPILSAVEKTDENSILLKFTENPYLGAKENIFTLKIFGQGIAEKMELIKEYHLDTPTVIEDENTELTFYVGNLNESPDWGDWGSFFSLPFEKYEEGFIDKNQ